MICISSSSSQGYYYNGKLPCLTYCTRITVIHFVHDTTLKYLHSKGIYNSHQGLISFKYNTAKTATQSNVLHILSRWCHNVYVMLTIYKLGTCFEWLYRKGLNSSNKWLIGNCSDIFGNTLYCFPCIRYTIIYIVFIVSDIWH
jgi:hypothetical protein